MAAPGRLRASRGGGLGGDRALCRAPGGCETPGRVGAGRGPQARGWG